MHWKSVVELVGIIGVLIGLAFVFREIELSSTIARAQLSGETNNRLDAVYQRTSDPEFVEVWLKSIESPEKLTTVERLQLNNLFGEVLQAYRRECYYMSLGFFVECDSFPRATALYFFGSKYGRAYWEAAKDRDRVGPPIAKIVDKVLAENTSTDSLFQFDKEVLNNLNSN